MIKNNRRYRVAMEQIRLLSTALGNAKMVKSPDVFVAAHIASLETDIARLEEEVRQYESLKQGSFDLSPLRNIEHIGTDLVRARIACNLTHKELAQALGKKEQVIQRWEASDYRTASLSALTTIANVIMHHQKNAA